MRRTKTPKRWSVLERQRFIDRLTYWRGELRRSDVIRQFGVSVQMASADIKAYLADNPGALRYDSRRKLYVAEPAVQPLFTPHGIEDAFPLLGNRDMVIGPWVDRVVPPHRDVRPRVAQAIFRAVLRGTSVQIRYASLHSASFRWRWISPHAFASDGFRWHVRAFCHEDHTFKDFVLGRIASIGKTAAPAAGPNQDSEWQRIVDIVLTVAPELSRDEVKALELDFGMAGGVLRLKVREALRPYVLSQLGLQPDGQDPKQRFVVASP